jgi:hypothetical protein
VTESVTLHRRLSVEPTEKRRAVTIITGAIGAVALASAIALALEAGLRSEPKTQKLAPMLTPPPLRSETKTSTPLATHTVTASALDKTNSVGISEVPRSALGRQLLAAAEQLYSPNVNNDAKQDAEIEKLAENLNSSSAHELIRTALDPRRSQAERFVSVYVIGLRASRFTKELTEIARSQPQSADESELAIRLQAMSALDSLVAMEPKLTKSIFQSLERDHTNPLLQKIARLGMKGAREGQPLIQKYIDMEASEVLDESN